MPCRWFLWLVLINTVCLQAVHAAANHKASAYTTDYDHSNYDDQMQTDEYAPTATDVTSHQISISPERPHAASTDGSELVVDVVRQVGIAINQAV